jgi:hypothetical protein
MANSADTDMSSEEMGRMGVLSINQLQYMMPADLSVVISRTLTQQQMQSQTYAPSSLACCILNTGSSYVNGRQSYIVMDVKNLSKKRVFFGTSAQGNSAANLISRVTLTSRSGQSFERVENANVLSGITLMYNHDRGYRQDGPATAAGAVEDGDDLAWDPGTVQRFCIPLSLISPFFASTDQLLPSSLCSGMKIELQLAPAAEALVQVAAEEKGDTLDYAIVRCHVVTESYLLSDLVMRSLNNMSATSGLEVTSKSCYNNITVRSTSQINIDVSKSVSRALSFVYKERPSFQSAVRPVTTSFFESVHMDAKSFVSEFGSRIGALYLPQSSIRGENARITGPELYIQTLRSFGKNYQGSGVSAGVPFSKYLTGSAIVGQDLERSNILDLSGIPLSTSRLLNINASFGGTALPTEARIVDVFLYHVVLLRVFGSNLVVEI